jgi:ubiquinone/menaquinone biosynthesis C-methylase UbiE
MPTDVHFTRWSRILAWAIAALFLLGFFFSPIGSWTGPILAVWFVGTQKPLRGFLWMMLLAFVPTLIANARLSSHSGLSALQFLDWMFFAAVLGILPFLLHRLTSPRLPGVLSTLPLPLWQAVRYALALSILPTPVFTAYFALGGQSKNLPLMHFAGAFGASALIFLVYWFAAVIVWMWNHEFRASRIALGASLFAALFALSIGYGLFRQLTGSALPESYPTGTLFAWISFAAALALTSWAFFRPGQRTTSWAFRPMTLRILQSPYTGHALQLLRDNGREKLVSHSGERFPIRDGIAILLKPEDLTGSNLKYNHLYETIGGFYDDSQRVVCALSGFDRDDYVRSYLDFLEVKPGDSVLETSVGTGLNFKYLPRGVKLAGLDLSPEMLANCQANLRRWQLDADLFLGNAESLPFADSSFDVVFHVGGINFFNDRGKAIRETIRVAKPGSLILIADETEEHVKAAYERAPITGGLYKNRQEPVTPPVDLVPPQMLETHLEILNVIGKNRFYVLTFRKPLAA